MRLINAYTISPNDIQPGDQMLFIVKAMVNNDGTVGLYRCQWMGSEDDIPQGERLHTFEKEIVASIFPALGWSTMSVEEEK